VLIPGGGPDAWVGEKQAQEPTGEKASAQGGKSPRGKKSLQAKKEKTENGPGWVGGGGGARGGPGADLKVFPPQ